MSTCLARWGLSLAVLAGAGACDLSAQNLVITNARVLDGLGGAIPRGSVSVRDGRVASVTAGTPLAIAGARVIDAQGKTLMPGFIDAHRHLIQGDASLWLERRAPAQMQEFLDAGFTTVLSAVDPPQILDARRRIRNGTLKGPRLFAAAVAALAAPVPDSGPPTQGDPARFDTSRPPRRPTRPARAIPPEETTRRVDDIAKAGFDYIKTFLTVTPGGPEKDTLKLIVQEGKKRNLPTITHAVSVIDTVAAVEAAPAVLVHTPHIGRLDEDAAAVQMIAKAGIPMTSTLAVFIPHFSADNQPLFRDGRPFPWDTISSAGQGPVNARLLWEAGLSYGFGTDTTWPPRETLSDELRALALVFSPQDIVTILTRNAAASVLRANELGTIEAGKLADMVIIDGDPLADVRALLRVVTTIKEGVVVSEHASH
jgi:imidazolonepropionase-like amidohydrolase